MQKTLKYQKESGKKTILLVEDEALIAMNEAAMLEKHSYKVLTAYNAKKAIDIVNNQDIDLILLDIDLGKRRMDGTDVAETILKDHVIPIVFLTNHSEKEMVDKVKGITSYGYVLKNSGYFVLLESINMAFELLEANQRLRAKEIELQEIMNNIESAVIRFNSDGCVTFYNSGAERVLGYTADEMLGKNQIEMILPNPKDDDLFRHPERYDYCEKEYIRKDGKQIFLAWKNKAVYDGQGNILFIQAIGNDITIEKEVQTRKQKEYEQMGLILSTMEIGLTLHNINRKIAWVNDYIKRAFPHGNVVGKTCYEFFEDRERPCKNCAVKECFDTGKISEAINKNYKNKRWFQSIAHPLKDKNGHIEQVLETITDITKQKQNEELLKKSDEKLRCLLENLSAAVFAHDLDGNFVFVNKKSLDYTGYFRDELLEMKVSDIDRESVSRNDREKIWKQLEEWGQKQLEVTHFRKDGTSYPAQININAVKLNNEPIILAIAQDISTRKKIEKEIQESKEKYKGLFENTPLPYQSLDENGCLLEVNPAWLDILGGYTLEEVFGKPFTDFIHPDSMENFRRNFAEFKKTGVAGDNHYKMRKKNGEYIDVSFTGRVAYSPEGKFLQSHCIFQVLSARKEAEEKLRFQAELLEAVDQAVIATDLEGNITYLNRFAEELYGWNRAEALHRNILDVTVTEKSHHDGQKIMETLAEGKTWEGDFIARRKDGTEFYAHVKDAPIFDDSGKLIGIIGISTDVSDQKKAEEELVEAQLIRQELIKASKVGLWDWDLQTDKVQYSHEWKEQIGYSDDEIEDDLEEFSSRVHPEDKDRLFEEVDRTIKNKSQNHETEFRFRHKDGSFRWILAQGSVIADETGKAVRMLGSHIDIANVKRIQHALENSERRFRYILKHDPNAIAVYDKNLHYIIASDRYIKDYGIEGKEVIGKHHYEVFPEMPQRWKDIHQRVLKGEVLRNDNDSFVREDGSITYNRWECRPWYTIDGEIGGMITYTEVTTERVKAEKQKDFLMAELNHRVKNNLLMVSSLVKLKDAALGDAVDLSDLAHRIDAIRIIHEKLYKSEDSTRIDVKEYIDELLDTVFSLRSEPVRIDANIELDYTHTRTAVSLGLIINEIATNAIKHGFPAEREARFTIDLRKDNERNEYVLKLSNNGSPFPGDIDLNNPESLGLRLISELVGQLEGQIELTPKPHPVFLIRFPSDVSWQGNKM